ncbi:sterile alpha motif domain-containing protein 3-like [Salvelinus alpinus]|uniref:sterile alpha motif domain-containing protein 3-like n=1 Tax=Salvelinus alpinus TaxID=8036 RepID=UPI0039FC6067
MNQVHGMDIDKKIIQGLAEVERRGRGLETTAAILLLPNLFNEDPSGLYVRDKISPLFTPLLHIGGNPFHHESEIPLAFDGENIHALEDVPMGLGALLGLHFLFSLNFPKNVRKTFLFLSYCVLGRREVGVKLPGPVIKMANFLT